MVYYGGRYILVLLIFLQIVKSYLGIILSTRVKKRGAF